MEWGNKNLPPKNQLRFRRRTSHPGDHGGSGSPQVEDPQSLEPGRGLFAAAQGCAKGHDAGKKLLDSENVWVVCQLGKILSPVDGDVWRFWSKVGGKKMR